MQVFQHLNHGDGPCGFLLSFHKKGYPDPYRIYRKNDREGWNEKSTCKEQKCKAGLIDSGQIMGYIVENQ